MSYKLTARKEALAELKRTLAAHEASTGIQASAFSATGSGIAFIKLEIDHLETEIELVEAVETLQNDVESLRHQIQVLGGDC